MDAVWFTPWYVSPLVDGGYDVADYRTVDPAFGTLGEAEKLIAEARELGIRTIVDIVPNHVSDQHAWFRAALEAGPGSAERERFHFPSRPRGERRTPAQQLALAVLRPHLDPGPGRRVVPPPVHPGAARPTRTVTRYGREDTGFDFAKKAFGTRPTCHGAPGARGRPHC